MIDCDGSFSRCRRLYSIVALPTDGAETSIDQREAAFLEVISPWSRVHISLMSRQVSTLRQILPQRETVFL